MAYSRQTMHTLARMIMSDPSNDTCKIYMGIYDDQIICLRLEKPGISCYFFDHFNMVPTSHTL